jgi:hypothetical protein
MFQIRGLTPTTLISLCRQRPVRPQSLRHVFLCIADHWEPKWSRPSRQTERERVARWARDYPVLASQFTDCRGRHPQHTFFYPEEEYEPEHLDALSEIQRQGFGDVEVHLHHDRDTAAGLREKLSRFTETLHNRHGLLHKDAGGRLRYAFIHGNWALDNSRPDGRWCGVNNELSILMETGCYADFTMPSAPAPCQTTTINSIYYAADDPHHPKSHDQGAPAHVGCRQPPNTLLMVQGPLALDWGSRKWGFLPRIENGDLTATRPPSLARLELWMQAGVKVGGQEDWAFVKLHTHGAQESNMAMLLGQSMHDFHRALATYAAEQPWFRYYYVTASEMAGLVYAAENGLSDPSTVLDRKAAAVLSGRAACR